MAAIWHRSFGQELDDNRDVRAGAKASFFEAATSTPMSTFSAAGLGDANENSNPVIADGDGRWPAVFFDDSLFSFYKVRVTDAGGSLLYEADGQPVIGQQVGEGGAEVPVNPTSLFDTGDVKARFAAGSLSGWVRMNGRTIGSASSGATERANADTQALFEHLWAEAGNTILAVSGGRGVSAAADFAANKTIALPDLRGRVPAGVNSMGNSASAVIRDGYIDAGGGADIVGSAGGDDGIALVEANLAAHLHGGGTLVAASHRHFIATNDLDQGVITNLTSISRVRSTQSDFDYELTKSIGGLEPTLGRTSLSGTSAVSGSSATAGSGTEHENMPPFMLLSYYIKL